MHSITLVLCEQVSHCSQKFMPGSSHLAAGNISKTDLTNEVLPGKGSSPAPSSPGYQRLRLVSSQHQLPWGLPFHTACAQFRLTLLIPSHHLLFQVHLERLDGLERISTGEEMTWAIHNHSPRNTVHRHLLLRKAVPHFPEGLSKMNLCYSTKTTSRLFPLF